MTIVISNKIQTKFVLKIILCLTICGAISGELFCRYILGLGDPPLSITHPKIEYMYKPNQDVNRFGNRILINQYGMRTENFSPHKQSTQESRVMIFGDSVVNGGNLTDHQRLATTIVQNKLKNSNNNPVIVGNISAGSWGPGNWLEYAKEYGFFEADTIVLVISTHDYVDNPTFAPLNPNTHPQHKPICALIEGFTRYLPRYLPILNLEKINSEINWRPQPENEKISQFDINEGLKNLKKFLLMAKQTGADVYVVQYWARGEVEKNIFESEGHQKINQLVRGLKIPIFQSGKEFQNAYKHGDNPFRDDIHPNDKGQELLANMILDILLDY
jgi:lysophospholipase L1-like esterase